MSMMMALGGLAPMIAPVLGGAVLTFGGTWRTVFWVLVGLGVLMLVTARAADVAIPSGRLAETLPVKPR